MISTEAVLGLPGYQITDVQEREGRVTIGLRYGGPIQCPDCGSTRLRWKGLRLQGFRLSDRHYELILRELGEL